jgi:hypothetical protein
MITRKPGAPPLPDGAYPMYLSTDELAYYDYRSCGECKRSVAPLVVLGDDPIDDCSPFTICRDCLVKAVRLIDNAKRGGSYNDQTSS